MPSKRRFKSQTSVVVRVALLCWCNLLTAQEVRPGVLRTPDERFQDLPGFAFQPHYVEINGYRVHYVDEGPRQGAPVLLLHGEPTWSYLYRKMSPPLTTAGLRVIAPDLIGFGRSDQPIDRAIHTYAFHVDAMTKLVTALDLRGVTFFGQDWGGLIGLRVVAENPDRFAAVVISNTALPTGIPDTAAAGANPAFAKWKAGVAAMAKRGDMPVGMIVAPKDSDLASAYDAPFPDARYKVSSRRPTVRNSPASSSM